MKTSHILIFCACILGTSCQKDIVLEDHSGVDPSPVTSIANIGDTITFGLVDNMLIEGDSIVLQPGINQSLMHAMDVDADGVTDFQIFMQTSVSLGAGFQAFSLIRSVHPNATVRGLLRPDTTFVHDDTVSANNIIHRVYSCRREGPFDTISSIVPDVTKILAFQSGNMLTAMDVFYADTIALRRTNYSSPVPTYEPPYQIQTTADSDCFLLPLGEVVYIGFAMLDGNGGERLGWWKLDQVTSSKIVIYEQAIQAP